MFTTKYDINYFIICDPLTKIFTNKIDCAARSAVWVWHDWYKMIWKQVVEKINFVKNLIWLDKKMKITLATKSF